MENKIYKKKLREFGLLVGIGFPLIIGWLIPFIVGHNFRIWTIWIGLSGLILGLISPKVLYYPYKFWMKLGYLLGWFNSRIILGFIFFIVLLPISFLMRLSKYDPLRKNFKEVKTYKEKKLGHKTDLTRIF